jgi:hypothetical protein
MLRIIKFILIKFLKISLVLLFFQIGAFITVFLTPLLVNTHHNNIIDVLLVYPIFISIGLAVIIITAKITGDDLWDFKEFHWLLKKI